MRRVNNFNKKKKKEFKARRTAATSDTIRVQTRSSRPSTPFPFVAPKSWRRTVPRCIIRRDDAPRRVPLFVRWNEEFTIAITIISFFPLLISFFQQSEDLAAREQNFWIIVRVILLCLKWICIVSCEMAVRFICIIDFGLIFVRMKKNLNLFSCRKYF